MLASFSPEALTMRFFFNCQAKEELQTKKFGINIVWRSYLEKTTRWHARWCLLTHLASGWRAWMHFWSLPPTAWLASLLPTVEGRPWCWASRGRCFERRRRWPGSSSRSTPARRCRGPHPWQALSRSNVPCGLGGRAQLGLAWWSLTYWTAESPARDKQIDKTKNRSGTFQHT